MRGAPACRQFPVFLPVLGLPAVSVCGRFVCGAEHATARRPTGCPSTPLAFGHPKPLDSSPAYGATTSGARRNPAFCPSLSITLSCAMYSPAGSFSGTSSQMGALRLFASFSAPTTTGRD